MSCRGMPSLRNVCNGLFILRTLTWRPWTTLAVTASKFSNSYQPLFGYRWYNWNHLFISHAAACDSTICDITVARCPNMTTNSSLLLRQKPNKRLLFMKCCKKICCSTPFWLHLSKALLCADSKVQQLQQDLCQVFIGYDLVTGLEERSDWVVVVNKSWHVFFRNRGGNYCYSLTTWRCMYTADELVILAMMT